MKTVQTYSNATCLIAIWTEPDFIFAGAKYSILDKLCYAEFLVYYILVPRKTDNEKNDSQQGKEYH